MKRLLSSEHFSVDGTLIEAWASHEELPAEGRLAASRPAPGRNGERNFHKEKRSNETHASHHRPGRPALPQGPMASESRLCFMGHVLMENRNGLVVDADAHPCHRHGRARGGADDARPPRGRGAGSRSAPTRPTT